MEEKPRIHEALSSTFGLVPGPYRKEYLICQYTHMSNSLGSIWSGVEPLSYSTPLLMAQFIVFFFVSRTVYWFIKPLRQSTTSAEIIAGIIMGPSLLAQDKKYAQKLLPPDGKLILSTAADVGFMFHLFLLGIQTDTSMLRNAGKKAALIGTLGFTLAYIFGGLAMFTLPQMVMFEENLLKSLPFVVTLNSISSFPVITSLLADLNILNSEIGRLATLCSMVNEVWSYFVAVTLAKIGISFHTGRWELIWSTFWIFIFVLAIVYVLRPLILMISGQMAEGKPLMDGHFIFILVIVLGCGFCAEVVGLHSGFGSFILGIAIPDGPPLGETLVYKLEALSTGMLLPVKFVITGLNVNLPSVQNVSALVVELIIICTYLGKFVGTLVSGLYCSIPFRDAASLALIMSCKGIVDVALFCMWMDEGILSHQVYALQIITMLIVTGLARLLVGHLYDPSKRYMLHTRSTSLQSHHHNDDFRILVCIHDEDNVPTIINLLEASSSSKQNPISIFVLNLMELKGRAASVLVPNFRRGKLISTSHHSQHIVNAFTNYAEQNKSRVILQHFTSVAPYSSMHDDICNFALDQFVTIVIVPFHKQWTIDGTVGAISPSIRAVNLNVITKAPCSVGVLVDRTNIGGFWKFTGCQSSTFRIALLFLGGSDDREALAYGTRLLNHQNVALNLVCIRPWAHKFRKEMEEYPNIPPHRVSISMLH